MDCYFISEIELSKALVHFSCPLKAATVLILSTPSSTIPEASLNLTLIGC